MDYVLNRMPWSWAKEGDIEPLLTREWLVTNGLGGYASGSISGASTRRYHGLLVAALAAPLGRTVMFNHLAEELRLPDGSLVRLGGMVPQGADPVLHGAPLLAEFRLEHGLPIWRYSHDDFVLEKRILLPYRHNTALVSYRLESPGARVRLRLRPSFQFRRHEEAVSTPVLNYDVAGRSDRFEISARDYPCLRMYLHANERALVLDGGRTHDVFYRVEAGRGYDSHGQLWSPGYFRCMLEDGETITLLASTEDWETCLAVRPEEVLQAELDRGDRLIAHAHPAARRGVPAELVLAADQFIIMPNRMADAARSRAEGDEARTVIAGYHWFTDWGRDTMISLEGLTLTTGRHAEAGYILRTFAHYVRDGLIPNLFPEGGHEGLYHTADATLWYFHAVDRYVQATGDRETLATLLPTLEDIVRHHLKGTHYNIRVDSDDGLLSQGQEGYQLTWMDAKVEGWVVTPRRGKAVEINALWYNALRLLEGWLRDAGRDDEASQIGGHAARCYESFNRRFWRADAGCLFDVVDGEQGDDPAFRPNQVFAISMPNAVLAQERWESVLHEVTERLLTPMGLRSLAPGEKDYKPLYNGDLRARDAAYHQGTVWGWLIGPYVDAWLKVYPDQRATARQFLEGFRAHLGEACIGSISEIFDAEAPFTPRGCVAQAWSVAEALRAWVLTEEGAAS